MPAVATINREDIISKVAAGHRLTDIGKEYGISAQAISKQLLDDPEYQAARLAGHTARLDEAEEGILSSQEQVDVARARAYWSAVSWRAEREHPAQYGPKQQIVGNVTITVIDQMLAEKAGRLIEQVADSSTDTPSA